jgi:ABC-type uncharacterized transport system substrate-binding protein
LKGLDEADALLGVPGGVTSRYHERMIAAANSNRRPSAFYTRTRSTRDALLTCGANDADVAREAARVVDKILTGANAGDLPVERSTRLRKSSNSLGRRTIRSSHDQVRLS